MFKLLAFFANMRWLYLRYLCHIKLHDGTWHFEGGLHTVSYNIYKYYKDESLCVCLLLLNQAVAVELIKLKYSVVIDCTLD